MQFVYNDGGRKKAGFKGDAGDCVVRAIAIAAELPYREVYNHLSGENLLYSICKRDRVARNLQKDKSYTPRDGVNKKVYGKWLADHGWIWHPTMTIGSGCRVHLEYGELPMGKLIVRVSKHLVAVIDGVIHDTYDPSRDGKRCVYGYWSQV